MTPAGFHAWRRRGESAHAAQDRRRSAEITRLFTEHHEWYGSPRIHRLLIGAGWTVGRRRVARLMRAAGLRAKAVRGSRPKAKTLRRYARHPDHLRGLVVTRPNQVWVGDITYLYLRVADGWRYLAIVMDQSSRRILAWSLTRRRTAAVTCAVLARAARGRRPARGVIFHSDRGSEYMGEPFCALVARLGLRQSASARGPEDKAHAESFGVLLPLTESGAHTWHHVRHRAPAPHRPAELPPLLQHDPPAFEPPLHRAPCLRATRGVEPRCQRKRSKIPGACGASRLSARR